jgi:hypothetical protein
MSRHEGGAEKAWLTAVLWAAVAFLWIALILPNFAHSKTVSVCADGGCIKINLPAEGKCIYRDIRGYKVRIYR